METTREPYEFLVRWIPSGVPENQYQGTMQAQINFAYVTRDDAGVVVQWTPDSKGPYPVAISGENGIDLIDIFPSLNSAALIASANAQAALSQALARIEELEAYVPPTSTVLSVSRMQSILALHDADLLSSVEQIIAQADPRTQLAWNTATEFSRTSPTIAALWQALGKTSEELDALFVAAKQIEV